MNNQLRKGDVVRAFVEGHHRELVIDAIASDGRLAQCYWTEGRSKHFVMLFLGAEQNAQEGPAPAREQGQAYGR